MPTLDQILGDEQFKAQGLPERLGTIDQYWDAVEEARPEEAPKAQLLRQLSKAGHESGYRSAFSPEGPAKAFHVSNFQKVDEIYRKAIVSDPDSPEFLSALRDYGQFVQEGSEGLAEAQRNETQMMQAAEELAAKEEALTRRTVFDADQGIGGLAFRLGTKASAPKELPEEQKREPLRIMREAAARAGVEFKEGDEEKLVRRFRSRKGEFKEPFRVGEEGSLFASGEALLMPREEAFKLAEQSGAARTEIDDFKRDFDRRQSDYVRPMIAMHERLGRREDLERPGKGTVEEQAAEMIRTVRKKVFRNALAEGLDKTGQFINDIPVIGKFTEKIADPEELKKKEEFFEVLNQYASDRYDYSLMQSAKRAVGGSLPDLALSALGASLGVAAGRAVGLGSKSLTTAGVAGSATLPSIKAGQEAFEQAQEQGKSDLTSLRLAATTFLTEFGPTMLLGRTGKEALLVPGAAREARKGLIRRFAESAGYEALEEELTFVSDLFVNQMELNPDMTVEEAIQGAVDSGIAGGVLGLTGGFARQAPALPEVVDPDAAELLEGSAEAAPASTEAAAEDVLSPAQDEPAAPVAEAEAAPEPEARPVAEGRTTEQIVEEGKEFLEERTTPTDVTPEPAVQEVPPETAQEAPAETTATETETEVEPQEDGLPPQETETEAPAEAAQVQEETEVVPDSVVEDDPQPDPEKETRTAFFGDNQLSFYEQESGVVVTSINAEEEGAGGREMLMWLRSQHPDKVIGTEDEVPGAAGFWQKMENEGLIGEPAPPVAEPVESAPAATEAAPTITTTSFNTDGTRTQVQVDNTKGALDEAVKQVRGREAVLRNLRDCLKS